MSRERIEDLGRLMVLLNQMTDSTLFARRGAEEFVRYYKGATTDDDLYDLHHEIEVLKERIMDCWEIASGQDWLNEHNNE